MKLLIILNKKVKDKYNFIRVESGNSKTNTACCQGQAPIGSKFLKNPGGIEVAISPLQPFPRMRFVMMENIEQIVGYDGALTHTEAC